MHKYTQVLTTGTLTQVNDVTTGVHWLSIEDQKQLNTTQC